MRKLSYPNQAQMLLNPKIQTSCSNNLNREIKLFVDSKKKLLINCLRQGKKLTKWQRATSSLNKENAMLSRASFKWRTNVSSKRKTK